MIHKVKKGDFEYPFFFGMREIYSLTQSKGIEFHEVDQTVSMDFDVMLKIFHLGSKKGVRRLAKEDGVEVSQYEHLQLSEVQIEDFIDDDPDFYAQLDKAFADSRIVKKIFDEAEPQDEKTKSPKN